MADRAKKIGQILGEFKTTELLVEKLAVSNIETLRSLEEYRQEYQNQYNSYDNLTTKETEKLDKYLEDMNGVFDLSAKDMHQFVINELQKFDNSLVDVRNTSKENLSSDVKVDIEIKIGDVNHKISLKQYEKDSNIQLCSGTYTSSLCTFAFNKIGTGKFQTLCDNKFVSKNRKKVREHLHNEYGKNVALLYDDIELLETSVKPYQVMSKYPGDSVWKAYCESTGLKASSVLSKILFEINKKRDLKDYVLRAAGLDGGHHLLISCNKTNPTIYSTLTCKKLENKIASLNDPNTIMNIVKHGQSVRFVFVNGDEELTKIDMPCTINKNGAWHLDKDGLPRVCRLSKEVVQSGYLRPEKAKQMATSTNMWLHLKKLLN